MPTWDKATSTLINKARSLGGKSLSIRLSDAALVRLCAVVAADLNHHDVVQGVTTNDDLANGYYGTPLEWFDQPVPSTVTLRDTFLKLKQIADADTYFGCLCSLHKRRIKFEQILERQAIPRMEQIVPRSLLEYGLRPSSTLASWLVWRKWLYDVDNRSAQETGYLFEPILTAAIGGVSKSASTSPVRRRSDKNKGRQIDCLDDKLAYEFKMRVTIAASGQGRFKEELDFAEDCKASNYMPVLLVLDPTPSPRLYELADAFRGVGGEAHIGDDAWRHIDDKAGDVMGRFVERYVRTPVEEVDAAYGNTPESISLTDKGDEIVVQIGERSFSVRRGGVPIESEELATDEEGEGTNG